MQNQEDFTYQKVSTILGIKDLRRKRAIDRINSQREELNEPNRTIFGVEHTEGDLL